MSTSGETSRSLLEDAARTRWLDSYRTLAATLPRSTPTSTNASHAREVIDAELVGMRYFASAINERRNELTLPSLLPPEILALIFSFLAAVVPISIVNEQYSWSRKGLGWVYVSHVCRRWRNICLSHHSLWTHLTPDGRQPWAVFLERAKEAPLYIQGPFQFPSRVNVASRIRAILHHRHHIRDLTLYNIPAQEAQELVKGFNGALPLLHILSLTVKYPLGAVTTPSLPTNFLSECAPNLEQLTLDGVQFPWGDGTSKMTKFVFEQPCNNPMLRQSFTRTHTSSGVIQSLQKMPGLKVLRLHRALPDQITPSRTNIVSLPLLEDIDLLDDNDACWRLWSLLRAPLNTSLKIHGVHVTTLDTLILSTFQSYLRIFPNPRFSTMSISIPGHSPDTVCFDLSDPKMPMETPNESLAPGRPARPRITLWISCKAPTELLKRLIAMIALEDVCTLECTDNCVENARDFHDIFLAARSVVTLYLLGAGVGTHLASLIPPASATGSTLQVDKAVLFPKLRVLSCAISNFIETVQHAGAHVPAHEVMDQVLSGRNELDIPLKTLNIEQCDVLVDWVVGWEDLVHVVWDEDEGELAEPEEDEDDFF